MKKIVIILLIIAIAIIFILLNNVGSKSLTQKQKVTATIFPLYDIVRNIAGSEVKTELLLQPGASPHTYEPSPEDIKTLSQSQALFTIGHGLDSWATKLAAAENVKTIIVDKNLELLGSQVEIGSNENKETQVGGSVAPH